MDSPLNLAHQQARKADHVMKTGKFEDAIYCHKRAAEHILDAMQLTASTHALESLRLQHQYHIKQQDFLRGRQRRTELAQLNGTKSGAVKDSGSPVASQTSHAEDSRCYTICSAAQGELSEERLLSDTENYLVYRTLVETDSLLQFLANRSYGHNSLKDLEKHKETSQRQKTKEDIIAAAVKSPKDEKTIIEELRIHNDELRRHITLILKELESSTTENVQLTRKLEQYEQAQALYLDNVDSEDFNLPSLDLPPLEMPHFDFDTVKDDSKADNSQLLTSGNFGHG